METLQTLRHGWKRAVADGEKKGIMVVGKRTNVEYTNEALASDDDVKALAASGGKLFRSDAEDYFLYSRGAEDWPHIPDFVVGRRAYDNWLVDHAYHDAKVDLIDASSTVLALHLTGKDGNKAGHEKGPDNDWNIKALNPATGKVVYNAEWDNGHTDHCPFFTRRHGAAIAVQVRSHHARPLGRSLPREVYSPDEHAMAAPSVPAPAAPDPAAVAAAQAAVAAALPPPAATPPSPPSPPPPALAESAQAPTPKELFSREMAKEKGVKGDGVMPAKGLACGMIANMFTTFIDKTKDERKISAQMAVLKAYQRLRAHGVQAWVFTKSDDWAAKAEAHDVIAVRQFATNQHGTPLLSHMYKHVANVTEDTCGKNKDVVFDAYANGDIVFTKGLVDTLVQVRKGWGREIASGARKGVMVVGKRTNVEYHSQNLDSDDAVIKLSKEGKEFQSDAEDYFLFSRGSRNWDMMPNFVVGRRAYDNWLVDNSHHDDAMDVIDASSTVLALHLTAADGNKAGHKKGADNDHNINAINPVTKKRVHGGEWNHGRTDNGHFFTRHHGGKVVLHIRSGQAGSRKLPVAVSQR